MVRWITALVLLAGCMGAHADKEGSNPKDKEQEIALQQDLPKPAAFDGKRAMDHLQAICAIGPRMSGTQGMRRQQELMRKYFEDLGLKVQLQHFQAKQRSRAQIDMANMIVSFAPEKTKRVILCSHYDTRPIADREKDPRKWREPFVSANDGGSGVALLMELARHFKEMKIDVGVDLVFFDGEEYIWNNQDSREGGDEYFFGSKHFAETWSKSKGRPDYLGAILLDMIAGKDAEFPVEFHSKLKAEDLCKEIWGIARSLKIGAFKYVAGDSVSDDHIALQDVGIPAIDIIDFQYKHWHKLTDTPENCSAESMTRVATVLSVWLQRVR